jgi:hypothetical protein
MTTSQNLTVGTGASVQSAAIASTKVRLTANAAVHITVGVNPVANTANCELIAANQTRYVNMEGLNNKLAVIASSSTAEISIVPCGTVAASSRVTSADTYRPS